MLSEELSKIGRKKEIDQNDLCNIEKLAASIKNIDKIMLADEMIDEYGYSFARAGRDGDGDGKYSERYSRNNSPNYSRNSYRNYDYDYADNSRDYSRGYSGHYEHEIINKMRDVIEDAEKKLTH